MIAELRHLTDEEIVGANQRLQSQSPQEILRWAVDQFHPKLIMATAFGAEGCCLIHMLSEIEPGVRNSAAAGTLR